MSNAGPKLEPAAAIGVGCGVLSLIAGIFLFAVASAVCRSHLGVGIHVIAIAAGLLFCVLGVGLGLALRRSHVVVFAIIGSLAIGFLAEGLLLLVNQKADSAPAKVHVAPIVSAKHQRIRQRGSNTSFDATTDIVVSNPEGNGSIELEDWMYLRGTYPVGTKVRLHIRSGALGFAWLESYELDGT